MVIHHETQDYGITEFGPKKKWTHSLPTCCLPISPFLAVVGFIRSFFLVAISFHFLLACLSY